MPPRGKEKRENWLLIKERDEIADEADPLLEEITTSVEERPLDGGDRRRRFRRLALATAPASEERRGRRRHARDAQRRERLPLPKFRPPQLATLVDEPPEGDDWVHEFKYDGYRC